VKPEISRRPIISLPLFSHEAINLHSMDHFLLSLEKLVCWDLIDLSCSCLGISASRDGDPWPLNILGPRSGTIVPHPHTSNAGNNPAMSVANAELHRPVERLSSLKYLVLPGRPESERLRDG
jgi:hypothetical protein